jgi:ABC-type multidrug transport system ATPase subunit/pSer/pThr/pTyr-binding forkhead associated (FHA) protein
MSPSNSPEPVRVWVVGSAPDCDIVVNRDIVSSHHCRLAQYENGFALEDLESTNGTFVNGQALPARSRRWVTPQDAITLGATEKLPWPVDLRKRMQHGTIALPKVPSSGQWDKVITIGRAPESHQVLDYPNVTWNHARLLQDHAGRLFIEDLGSTNGTYIGVSRERASPHQPTPVEPDADVYFGSLKVPIAKLAGPKRLALGDASIDQFAMKGQKTVIGRDPSCDYPLDYPTISWHHAELLKEGGTVYVRDLDSRNGTYVDGAQVSSKTQVNPGSEVSLGSFRFRLLDASGVFARREYNGNVTIECVSLAVDVVKAGTVQRLLNPLSLTVFPSELIAVMGPAGAGKTTLLRALNGYTRPVHGRVLFNGADLYQFYDRFRLQLGYVPQDDIMHSLLTVQEALYFTAKLRTDLRDDEIQTRVKRVLTALNIDDIGQRQIGSPEKKVISGGQRKRVNIAMELLSEPSVLFLDEPTSGLSSYDALQVVRLLHQLAGDGKTILLTIHQPSLDIYQQFDNLIMVTRDKGSTSSGALAYFGPAFPQAIEFFRPQNGPRRELSPELLLDGLAEKQTADWVDLYHRSRFREEFVDKRAGTMPSAGEKKGTTSAIRKMGFGQWWTLVRRNTILRMRDRSQMAFMLLQAILFPALMAIVFGSLTQTDSIRDLPAWLNYAGKISTVHFLMVVAAIWFGCNNAARDIVGERAIFQRERMVSLKLPSYVFSKAAVLAVLGLVQCLILSGVIYLFCHLSGPFLQTLWTLWLAYQVGVAIGLLISSLADTTESAIALLPIPLLCMILLSGGIRPVNTMPPVARWLAQASPSRWAFEANVVMEANEHQSLVLKGATSGDDIAEGVFPARSADGTERIPVKTCWSILAAMFAVLLTSVLAVLRRRDIH